MNVGELTVQRCETCGRSLYPRRLVCAGCGRAEPSRDVPAGPGTIVDAVELYLVPGVSAREHDERSLFVLVELDSGPRVLARVDTVASRGERVRLAVEESGAVIASPA